MPALKKVINGFRRAGRVIRTEFDRRPDETRKSYKRRMIFFAGPMVLPVVCYGLLCLVMFARSGEDGLKEFGKLLAGDWLYFLPGAGKITAIPMMVEADLPPALIACSTIFLDTIVAFFVAFNFNYIQRFPITDRFTRVFLSEGEKLLRKHQWICKCSFLALVFYVMLPFKGSGGIGGTLLGMVIGLGRLRTWLAILTGSIIASFSLAYGAAAARAYLLGVRRGGYVLLAFFLSLAVFIIYKKRTTSAGIERSPTGPSEGSVPGDLSGKELALRN
jgi:uncharacterized membrane protein